jgi:two-component system alkaline phosphatase synthesis response regulator PhoP
VQAIFPACLPQEAGELYFRDLAKPCAAKRVSCDILAKAWLLLTVIGWTDTIHYPPLARDFGESAGKLEGDSVMQERSGQANQTSRKPLSSETFRMMFELSPSPRAVIDTRGRFHLVNQAFSHQLGYDPDRLLKGRASFANLFSTKGEATSLIQEIANRQVIRRREVAILDDEGHANPFLLSGNVLQLDGQSLIDISLTGISVQRRLASKLRRDHARMASLLESITAGLFLVNMDGEIEEFNLPLANLTGMDQESVVGDSYMLLFERLLSNAVDPMIAQQDLARSVDAVAERPVVEIVTHGDPPSHLEISFFPVWDEEGNAIGWGGLMQDITEARERMAWKMELLSMLAHDIRTPLATLKGHATALAANYHNWDDAMVREFLEAISNTTDSLTHQVDRSLALTRVEAGRMGLRPSGVYPSSLARQAAERSAGILGEREIEIAIPEEMPQVRVDPARIEETLTILVENAVRHAPSSAPIEIGAKRSRNSVFMWVMDDGPGIPSDRQRMIFEKYEQVEPRSEGAGLGLYIARKIVEAHGGRIWVESPPDECSRGAKFNFSVPIMPDQPQAAVESAQSVPARPAKKGRSGLVLIIEDQPDMQTLLHSILTQEGYEVMIASGGAEGLDLFKAAPPELVLLDWMLPEMNGLLVCRTIRRWSQVPMIVLTSRVAREDMIVALNAGADDYITKPFQPTELLARMNAAIRRSGEWREGEKRDQFISGPLMLDFDLQTGWLHGIELDLTPTEYRLLVYLVENRGRVLTYQQIINHLWEGNVTKAKKDVFVHISRLRKKIEIDPKNPRYIQTRWGVGYIFSGR